MKTGSDKVRVVADSAGQAHVLIASSELDQVLEVVVRPEGVAQRRVIRSGVSPNSIDGAFDERGRLHVLIDTEHMVLEEGAWRTSDRTPWREAGVKVQNAGFVADAPSLIWTFKVRGKQVGSPIRMDIYLIGSPMYALAWPWFTRGERTVFVLELPTGYGPWAVLEPHGKGDTELAGVAADNRGNVHVVYRKSRISNLRYARIGADVLRHGDAKVCGVSEERMGTRRFFAIEGRDFPPTEAVAGSARRHLGAIAVDPHGSTAVLGLHWVVHGEAWSHPVNKVHLDGYNFLPYLTGKEKKGPRIEYFYFSDDGDLLALRHGNWKAAFKVQDQPGTMEVWQREFRDLRLPYFFNLRLDPYERATITSNTYWDWYIRHVYLLVPLQEKVGEFLATFKEYPPRQKAASFTIDQVMEKMQSAHGG